MEERPFLDFYGKRNIIPVRQDISDWAAHIARRDALLRHLGIPRSAIHHARYMEIGPGSGDNALHIASLSPASITLLDGNDASLTALAKHQAEGRLPSDTRIIKADILEFEENDGCDIVWCEGVIPGQSNPDQFLRKVASNASENGIVVFTTVSGTSYLAEVCRRALMPFVREKCRSDEELVTSLVALFEPGLKSLKGMSRRHDDWVLDNIVHPWTGRGLFPFERAVTALDEDFDVLGMSPHILQDWRWYKNVPKSDRTINATAIESFLSVSAFMIDYRQQPNAPLPPEAGKEIDRLSDEALSLHDEFLRSGVDADFEHFLSCLRRIGSMLESAMPLTAESINSYLGAVPSFMKGEYDCTTLGRFHEWFGRGQQHVSMEKRRSAVT